MTKLSFKCADIEPTLACLWEARPREPVYKFRANGEQVAKTQVELDDLEGVKRASVSWDYSRVYFEADNGLIKVDFRHIDEERARS